jgi:RimJ/RimL family protein N-acetyltransferase
VIISEPRQDVARFVAASLGLEGVPWTEYNVLGYLRNGEFLGGVVYERWSDGDVLMHVAGARPGWLGREFLFAAFDYPFNQQGCRRVTALVPADNAAARHFDESLGFVWEGCLRQGTPQGDLLVYGMLKSECRWLEMKKRAA